MQPVLELIDVSKRYGGVRALERARFACASGRVHALLGENGAGKSTLIKMMAGVVQPDEGRIVLQGRERRFAHPQDAVGAGIACIFQELSLMPDLSVADNICITNPPRRFGLIDTAGAASHRRGGAGACRRRGHPSAGAGRQPVAVAPPDGRDRQGAGARTEDPDPRRGHLGADRGRRAARVRAAQAAARRGPGDRLHLAPHARDRRAGRRLLGVPQRPARGDLRRRAQDRHRDRRNDDRPRGRATPSRPSRRRWARPTARRRRSTPASRRRSRCKA